jgi:hypothetical protein
MKGKFTTIAFVVVLVVGFTMFVTGLESSRAGSYLQTGASDDAVGAGGQESEDGLTWVGETAGADRASEPGLTWGSTPRAHRVPGGVRRAESVGNSPRLGASPTPTRTPTPINIGNFVWDDIDGDGRQDAGEPGLADITVQLWNAGKSALLDAAVTNGSGSYTVTAPVPGDYRVRVLLPGGSDEFSPKNQASGDDLLDSDINPTGVDTGFTDVFTLASNVISITSIDAGVVLFRTPTPTRTPTPINIGNFVWDDIDGNGLQDAGEPGVAGVTAQLWNATKTTQLASDVTDSNGIYTVVAPIPGDYRVRFVASSITFSPQDAGASDLLDSDVNASGVDLGFTDVFTLASNVISITSIDAGLLDVVVPTPTATATPTMTPTATPTVTPTATPTVTPSVTPTVTPSVTPTVTPDATPTPTDPPGATPTPTPDGSTTTIFGGGSPTPPTGTPTATVDIPAIQRGAVQTGRATGFAPGEQVSGTQASSPLALGTQTADGSGSVVFTWTIRSGETLGTHTFTATGPTSGSASAQFEVIQTRLPDTGSRSVTTTLLWAAALLLLGATITWLVARSTRQTRSSV